MNELRVRLRAYMGEKDLSVREVAALLNRHPLTIWKFLHGKTEPNHQTLYQIKKLVGGIKCAN
jgi:transcriptional regulator with XRE-family HTH domain